MLRPLCLFASAFALCVFGVVGETPAATEPERTCGSVRDGYREDGTRQFVQASVITVVGVTCNVARKVSRAYISRTHFVRVTRRGERRVRNRFPKGAGRFHCAAEYIGSDVRLVTCRSEGDRIQFAWYDSSPYH